MFLCTTQGAEYAAAMAAWNSYYQQPYATPTPVAPSSTQPAISAAAAAAEYANAKRSTPGGVPPVGTAPGANPYAVPGAYPVPGAPYSATGVEVL